MEPVSRMARQKSWQSPRQRVSVLAEMALRREKVMERLLELRERHGLSQEDAAHKVGITTRQWQRWETGESMPYPRNLDAVASKFGIGIAEFFDPPADISVDVSQLDRLEAKIDELLSRVAALELGASLDVEDVPPVAHNKKPAAGRVRTTRSSAAS